MNDSPSSVSLAPRNLSVYVDGAHEFGICAWAFVVMADDQVLHESSGTTPDTYQARNVTAELHAVLEADRWLREQLSTQATIISDYEGVREWMEGGWQADSRVARDYVTALKDRRNFLSFRWVKGHSGVAGNERAHELAESAIKAELETRPRRTDFGLYCASDLKQLGWKPSQIKALGEPDEIRSNPHGKGFAPMKLFYFGLEADPKECPIDTGEPHQRRIHDKSE
jgi:ribonuclease HI